MPGASMVTFLRTTFPGRGIVVGKLGDIVLQVLGGREGKEQRKGRGEGEVVEK
jgi:hypothetical protein